MLLRVRITLLRVLISLLLVLITLPRVLITLLRGLITLPPVPYQRSLALVRQHPVEPALHAASCLHRDWAMPLT